MKKNVPHVVHAQNNGQNAGVKITNNWRKIEEVESQSNHLRIRDYMSA